VPNVDQAYAQGLTLLQHEIIRASQRMQAEGRVDRAALLRSKERIQRDIERLLFSKSLRDRRAGAKHVGLSSQNGDAKGENVLARFHAAQSAQANAPKRSTSSEAPEAAAAPPVSPAEPQASRPLLPARRFNTRQQGGAVL
jgi:hypothetical protein